MSEQLLRDSDHRRARLRCSNTECELRKAPFYEWTFHVTLVVYGDWDIAGMAETGDHVPVCLNTDAPHGGSDVRTECFKCTHCGSVAENVEHLSRTEGGE